MKRKILILMILFIGVLVSGCSDRKYSDDRVNVIFYTSSNEGATEIPSILDIEPGSLIERPEDPVRPGYAFGGWFSDLDYKLEWDFENQKVGDTSLVLYAKWIQEVYTITYDLNGGVMPDTEYRTEYKTGDFFSLPIPQRTGYTFVGWFLYDWDEENPNTKPGDKGYQTLPKTFYGDVTFYAHWKIIQSIVSFDVNFPIEDQKPASPKSRTMKYGDIIDFETLPDTAGYRFIGWNSRRDGTGEWFINGEAFTRTQRTTVYAIWEPIEQSEE